MVHIHVMCTHVYEYNTATLSKEHTEHLAMSLIPTGSSVDPGPSSAGMEVDPGNIQTHLHAPRWDISQQGRTRKVLPMPTHHRSPAGRRLSPSSVSGISLPCFLWMLGGDVQVET